MGAYDWATQAAKGWLDVTVAWGGGRQVVEVYDPVRLAQSTADEIDRLGRFTASSLLVVASVTRENVESALSAIAAEGFFDQTSSH